MTPTNLRNTLAAGVVAVAGAGVATGATAGNFGGDKASAPDRAEPAAKVVEQNGRQVATVPTEKNNQPACETPAARTSGQPDTQMAVEPRTEKCP